MTRPELPTTRIVEVDKDRNDVTREVKAFRGFMTDSDWLCHRAVKFFEESPSAHWTSVKRYL